LTNIGRGKEIKSQKLITVDPDLCTNCRACELTCSAFHFKHTNPMQSRINVVYDLRNNVAVPVLCKQCQDPACMKVCPVHAIFRDVATNYVLLDEKKCVGCTLCVTACRFGGPSINPTTDKPIICDLCDGDPQCVKVCSQKALEYVDDFRLGNSTRRSKLRNLLDSMELKHFEELKRE
jgi:carbon-monoxide dehydrogenase iron sulfur subunit